jgi:hypothetical protein
MMILYAKTTLRPKYLSVDRLIKNITLYGRRCNQDGSSKETRREKTRRKETRRKEGSTQEEVSV